MSERIYIRKIIFELGVYTAIYSPVHESVESYTAKKVSRISCEDGILILYIIFRTPE